jgi:hypothetical protein
VWWWLRSRALVVQMVQFLRTVLELIVLVELLLVLLLLLLLLLLLKCLLRLLLLLLLLLVSSIIVELHPPPLLHSTICHKAWRLHTRASPLSTLAHRCVYTISCHLMHLPGIRASPP